MSQRITTLNFSCLQIFFPIANIMLFLPLGAVIFTKSGVTCLTRSRVMYGQSQRYMIIK